ncbi:MAG: hypothetical protein JHC95_11390 [Solirubrobacteraceae bacterium]|nr:hypothetical protein [Solirubrobacteraceae bacterium]
MPFVPSRGGFAALLLIASFAVVGCGGGDTSTAAQQGGPGQGGPGFMADEKVQKCLEDAGIEMPERPQGGPPQDGQQPPESGQRPPGGMRNSAEMEKMQAALKKCGIDMPDRRQGGPGPGGPGAPPAATTTTAQDS